MPLDVILAGPGLEDQFFAGATERMVGDVRVPVVCAEDLVAMKILAGRPTDLERLENQDRTETNALLAETRAKRQVAKADPRLVATVAVAVGVAWTAAVIIYFTLTHDWKIFIVPIALSIALAKLKGQSR